MSWRWFYSTEESDTALKAILDASKFSREYTRNENGLTDGVYEYKVWIEQDSEYVLLASKIDSAKIRALAAPERVTQFGNVRPDNYFDTTKYAAGCSLRINDTLAVVVAFLKTLPYGTRIAQRDLDIPGSASLGTVALVLSSIYKKTYNIPVNGSVSDRTLVKAVIDTTIPAVTQTNATCNSAMFDYATPDWNSEIIYDHTESITATIEGGTSAQWFAACSDKVQTQSTPNYNNGNVVFDYVTAKNRYAKFHFAVSLSATTYFEMSTDGVTYTNVQTYTGGDTTTAYLTLNGTFRYLRLRIGNQRIYAKELSVSEI